MAIGLSRMFGIKLPLNFDSPYKAANIIDFWRRWHMTLSRFLRDYLYIPLGGNRHGRVRAMCNSSSPCCLAASGTARAGRLLSGARCTACISASITRGINYGPPIPERWARAAGIVGVFLTFLAVVIAWVFFRADSLASALSVLSRMADPSRIVFGPAEIFQAC